MPLRGEEFALFMPNTSADSALLVIERIQEKFASREFCAKRESFHVTFSCGITEISERQQDTDKLIDEADQALYSSKYSGRNQTTLYSEGMLTGQRETVLNVIIVDDDPLIRRIITGNFASWEPGNIGGMKVNSYADGELF